MTDFDVMCETEQKKVLYEDLLRELRTASERRWLDEDDSVAILRDMIASKHREMQDEIYLGPKPYYEPWEYETDYPPNDVSVEAIRKSFRLRLYRNESDALRDG